MIKALSFIASVLLGCFSLSSASSALPYFTDQASWKAAFPGAHIGPYTARGTITETDVTIDAGTLDCQGLCVIDRSTTTTSFVGLSSLFAVMSFPNSCFHCTRTTEFIVTFDKPVLGVAGTFSGFNSPGTSLLLNGDYAPPSEGQFDQPYFLGAGNFLDFSSGCCSDNAAGVDLTNLIFATTPVPEPSVWSLMLAVLLGAGAVARRRAISGCGLIEALPIIREKEIPRDLPAYQTQSEKV